MQLTVMNSSDSIDKSYHNESTKIIGGEPYTDPLKGSIRSKRSNHGLLFLLESLSTSASLSSKSKDPLVGKMEANVIFPTTGTATTNDMSSESQDFGEENSWIIRESTEPSRRSSLDDSCLNTRRTPAVSTAPRRSISAAAFDTVRQNRQRQLCNLDKVSGKSELDMGSCHSWRSTHTSSGAGFYVGGISRVHRFGNHEGATPHRSSLGTSTTLLANLSRHSTHSFASRDDLDVDWHLDSSSTGSIIESPTNKNSRNLRNKSLLGRIQREDSDFVGDSENLLNEEQQRKRVVQLNKPSENPKKALEKISTSNSNSNGDSVSSSNAFVPSEDEVCKILQESIARDAYQAEQIGIINAAAAEVDGDIQIDLNNISAVDSDNDDDDDDNNNDSFCHASDSEIGNKAYIVQELGASYYFNDEGFFDHHVRPHVIKDDDAASLDEIIEEEVFVETMLQPASVLSKQVREQEEQQRKHLLHQNQEHDEFCETLIPASSYTVKDEDPSECDSFCDGNGSENPDMSYLEKDLGGSCYFECPTLSRKDVLSSGGGPDQSGTGTTINIKTSGKNKITNIMTIGEDDEEESEEEDDDDNSIGSCDDGDF